MQQTNRGGLYDYEYYIIVGFRNSIRYNLAIHDYLMIYYTFTILHLLQQCIYDAFWFGESLTLLRGSWKEK